MLTCLSLLLLAKGCFSATCDSSSYRQTVQNELKELATNKGYDITEGFVSVIFNSSYTASNPNSAYGYYLFKNAINGNYADQWGLSSSDAVIFSGCTMPKGAYFSFQHYLYTRFVNNRGTQLFADLGATINNLDINSSASSFDSLTTVVLTGDRQTAIDIISVLDEKTLNILSIPNEYVYFKPGIDSTVDAFAILYRMALWDNDTEFNQYINSINNQSVWKLSLKDDTNINPRIPYEPYVRDTNCSYNEIEIYNSTIYEYANDVIQYIESTYSYKYIESILFTDTQLPPYHYYGFDCITNNIDCVGETRDALYWASGSSRSNNILYNDNSFYLILGVNHVNTNQSEYISITLYDEEKLSLEVKGDLSNLQLNKSALLLPVNTDVKKEYLSNMWVTQLSRPINCMYDSDDKTLLIPGFCYNETQFSQSQFTLITRNYLNPQTKTHPNRFQVVPPILLYFEAQ